MLYAAEQLISFVCSLFNVYTSLNKPCMVFDHAWYSTCVRTSLLTQSHHKLLLHPKSKPKSNPNRSPLPPVPAVMAYSQGGGGSPASGGGPAGSGPGNLGQGGGGGLGGAVRRGSPNQHASLAGSPPPPIGMSGRNRSGGREDGGGGEGGGTGGGRGRGTSDPAVRRWLCLCIAKLCWQYTDAQDACVRLDVQETLFSCLHGKGECFLGFPCYV